MPTTDGRMKAIPDARKQSIRCARVLTQRRKTLKTRHMLSLMALGALSLAPVLSAAPAEAQLAYAPGSTVSGKTVAQWGEGWLQWAFSFPDNSSNPSIDTGSSHIPEHQPAPSHVYFLPCNISGEPSRDRTYSVPYGVPLLLSLDSQLASEAFAPGGPGSLTDQQLHDIAAAEANDVTLLTLTVDGSAVPDLFSYREPGPDIFNINLPDDSYGVPAGSYRSASDGYFLLFRPLSPGAHVIHLMEGDDFGTSDEFARITVVPEPGVTSIIAGLFTSGALFLHLKRRRRYN